MSHSNAYVEAFLTKKPKDGIHIVQQRLKDSMTLDMELADYLKERAQIEENYSKSLVKASKRLYTMDSTVLGHFAPIWETLLKEFNQIATYHSEMAFQIINEIEKPLRTTNLSEHYQKLEQMEPIIQSLEKKSNNKLSSVKGSIFKKSASKSTNPSWENEGVEYLETCQKVDESRLNRLKDSIEKFEQIQSKQLQKRIELTNATINSTKSFNVQNDIQDFCLERGKGLDIIKKRPKMSTSISHDSLRSTTSSTNKFKSVFMKKKNQHNRLDDYNDASPSEQSIENQEPLQVDAEGYSVPKTVGQSPFITSGQLPFTSSDISSHNTSDEVDSDYQSIKLNQRLQINIKEDIVKEEDALANESFNKMATILRERTPTITRKARGRRESSVTRSQTNLTLHNSVSDNNISTNAASNNKISRSNSMINFGTTERNSTNPFLQTCSPSTIHSANNFKLQPITEDQKADISIFVHEKSSIEDGNDISGKIFISYTGSTLNHIIIRLSNIEGIQRLYPNPQYITATENYYALNTSNIPQNERVICFTYELKSNETNSLFSPPVSLSASWKCIEGISYLMVKHINRNLTDSVKGSVQVHYDHVTRVESTPQGIWDTQNKTLIWQLKDLLQQYEQQLEQQQSRLLVKFFLTEGQVGAPQPISLNYQLEDTLASGLVVEVQDEPSINSTKISRKVYLEHLISN